MDMQNDVHGRLYDEYRLIVGGSEGVLVIGEEPYATFGDERYAVTRRMSKSSWGYIEFSYDVTSASGTRVWGSMSPREGMGVQVSPAVSWGFETITDGSRRLGQKTVITFDKTSRKITVTSEEPDEHRAAIICGVVMLADPQGYWESVYNQANLKPRSLS